MKKLFLCLVAAFMAMPLSSLAQTERIKVCVPDFKRFFLVQKENVNMRRLPNANSGKLMQWYSDAGSFDTYAKIFFSDTEAAKYRPNARTGAYTEPFHPYADVYLPVNPEQTEAKDGWYNVVVSAMEFAGNPGQANTKTAWINGAFGKAVDVAADGAIKKIKIQTHPTVSLDDERINEKIYATDFDKRKSGAFKNLGLGCSYDDNSKCAGIFMPVFAGDLLFTATLTATVEVNTSQREAVTISKKREEFEDSYWESLTITVNNPYNVEQNIKNYLLGCSDEEFGKVSSILFKDDMMPTQNVFFVSPDGKSHMFFFYPDYLGNIPSKTYTLAELAGDAPAATANAGSKSSGRQFSGKVFDMVENQPEFPGGQSALMTFLGQNINYPEEAIKKDIKGRVIVQFVVETDGSISNVNIIKSVDPLLDNEAARVIKSMPNWIPGSNNGKPVRVRFAIPINFNF